MKPKKIVILSRLDHIVSCLKKDKQPYNLTVLKTVFGINEIDNKEKSLLVRKLQYGNTFIFEQLIKTRDKELDNFLISKMFLSTNLPKKWKSEVIK